MSTDTAQRTTAEIAAEMGEQERTIAELAQRDADLRADLTQANHDVDAALLTGKKPPTARPLEVEGALRGVTRLLDAARTRLGELRAEYQEAKKVEARRSAAGAATRVDEAAAEMRARLRRFLAEELRPQYDTFLECKQEAQSLEEATGTPHYNTRAGMALGKAGLGQIVPALMHYLDNDPVQLEADRLARLERERQEHDRRERERYRQREEANAQAREAEAARKAEEERIRTARALEQRGIHEHELATRPVQRYV